MAPTLFDKPPKPGDLIEINRGVYQHWAIYVGDGKVVHLSSATHMDGEVVGLVCLVQSSDINRAVVKCDKIRDVVGQHPYHVNNLLDHRYEARDPNDIVKDALALVGRVLPYDAFSNNCEHFVTNLRYGIPESRQARNIILAGGIAMVGVAAVVLGAALFGPSLNQSSQDDEDD